MIEKSALHTVRLFLLICCNFYGCVLQPGQQTVLFPLEDCKAAERFGCVVRLFADDRAIDTRDIAKFPKRYLELWNSQVRADECARITKDSRNETEEECRRRLESVSSYFNPSGDRPDQDIIGVALEGGGSRSSPSSLGVLAGLQEIGLLDSKVGAVSSVSGGSYAASYLFNRLFDYYGLDRSSAGSWAEWFRSCIPSFYRNKANYLDLLSIPTTLLCEESRYRSPESGDIAIGYDFLGHVWKYPDILFADGGAVWKQADDFADKFESVANTLTLLAETAATLPFAYLSRLFFRWPLNSAPSKQAYKWGIDREFGYSPTDWSNADVPGQKRYSTRLERDETRTFKTQGERLTGKPVPQWILNANTPGKASPIGWFTATSRDPIRHQFELTTRGYGSGMHGYALIPPVGAVSDVANKDNGVSLSIADGVVASAAFFDDEQSLISNRWLRPFANAGQELTNITWFSEIPNFNVGATERQIHQAKPWPFYLLSNATNRTTPYIHLQDGGNSENTGIFPLLRRGYKTIVYSHSTDDRKAQFKAICHLKNQLEIDGTYVLVSPDLDQLAGQQPEHAGHPGQFANYLDQLCTEELDDSDAVTFGEGPLRDETGPLAKLICGRLGHDIQKKPCGEYYSRFAFYFPINALISGVAMPDTFKSVPNMFFENSIGKLTFKVYRANAGTVRQDPYMLKKSELISTIYALVPSVAWPDLARQLSHTQTGTVAISSWGEYCQQPTEEKKNLRINTCFGPQGEFYAVNAPGMTTVDTAPVPCTTTAFVLANRCSFTHEPEFPQDNFISQTLNSSYTIFAAYFDLARHQIWRICKELGGARCLQ